MIRSMTGYSEGRAEFEAFRLGVVLRSTNHRYLDLQFRLPRLLGRLEGLIRKILKEDYRRGHLEVNVTLEAFKPAELRMDRELLGSYVKACLDLRQEFGLSQEPDLAALVQIPGVVNSGNGEIDPSQWERMQESLERLTRQTLRELNEMRAAEGRALEKDLRTRVDRIRELARQTESIHAEAPSRAYQKIRSRMQKILAQVELDPVQVAQQAALLASQGDISEELARLDSHLGQAGELLDSGSAMGKKFDFLLQEMNREANTILSKTGGSAEEGFETTRLALEIKGEIEKMREQAQNIE